MNTPIDRSFFQASSSLLRCLLVLLLLSMPALAQATVSVSQLSPQQKSIVAAWPASLQEWVPWILQRNEQLACTRNSVNWEDKADHKDIENDVCFYVSPLTVDLGANRASFDFRLSARKAVFAPLPGDKANWPQDVLVDGQRAPVVASQHGEPGIYVDAGEHEIRGELRWKSVPQKLAVPVAFGPVQLQRSGVLSNEVYIDDSNDIWLVTDRDRSAAKPASLRLQVYRKLVDDQPKLLHTQLVLDVAGDSREAALPGFQLPGFKLIDLASPLPAKIESDGALKVQLQPGSFTINAVFRQTSEVNAYSITEPAEGSWPSQEIWVVENRPSLRRIEINGEAIDPDRTLLPADWKTLPAFRVAPGSPLLLKELDRGVGKVESNELRQVSTVWLQFDAREWLWRDRLTGRMNDGWRIEMAPPFFLGHVRLDGVPQSITQLEDSGLHGVEIRSTDVNLDAVSRLPALHNGLTYTMPASGWKHPLTELSLEIMLPPGWWALAALGADFSSGSWIDEWSVWDLFLILFAGVCVFRIYGAGWGMVALPAVAIAYQAAGVLLLLLIATLLLGRPLARANAVGTLRFRLETIRRIGHMTALTAFSVFLVIYAAEQLRLVMHPQLERPLLPRSDIESRTAADALSLDFGAPMASSVFERNKSAPSLYKSQADPDVEWLYDVGDQPLQTGPAIPEWRWHRVELKWQSAASQSESLRLIVLSRWQTATAMCIHLLLLAFLLIRLWLPKEYGDETDDFPDSGIFGSLGRRFRRRKMNSAPADAGNSAWQPGITTRLGVALVLGCSLPLLWSPSSEAQQLVGATVESASSAAAMAAPSETLLQQMEARLLMPPACLPNCVSVDRASLEVDAHKAVLTLVVSSQTRQMVPLPARRGWWVPSTVSVDGEPVERWHTDRNGVWQTELEAGVFTLRLEAGIEDLDQFKIYFPLLPRFVDVQSTDWIASGLSGTQLLARELTFERDSSSTRRPDARKLLFQEPAPAFAKVKRTLNLGVDWRVKTTVERVAPLNGSLTIDLPLLPGETLMGRFETPKPGWIRVTIQDGEDSTSWTSTLAPRSALQLEAPQNDSWTEQWNLAVGPLWRVTYTGIAPYSVTSSGVWQPSWLPRPGESVSLAITRPDVIAGKQLTIDQAKLRKTFSQSSAESHLTIEARASRSQRFSFRLPEKADITSVTLNGERVPQAQSRGSVDVILGFGSQIIEVNWTEPQRSHWRGATPSIEFPVALNNVEVTTVLPGNAWLLHMNGPNYGPALLFWPLLIVLLIAAVVAGLLRNNPLGIGQWMLLAAGASLGWVAGLGILLLWLTTLFYRERVMSQLSRSQQKAYQVLLIALTLAAFAWVLMSISRGLIGQPVDYVMGMGSTANVLNWYIDNTASSLPKIELFWTPIWLYRALALLWSLWLAFAMLAWLRWGWRRMSEPVPAVDDKDGPGTEAAADSEVDESSHAVAGLNASAPPTSEEKQPEQLTQDAEQPLSQQAAEQNAQAPDKHKDSHDPKTEH
ncbi:hypothetical protein [Allohahella sp. A8]|uniref:hypothetical protein n=1 Tax=Allohahella sp. A8 TaxID=3141461 RepID=UPI003A800CF5